MFPLCHVSSYCWELVFYIGCDEAMARGSGAMGMSPADVAQFGRQLAEGVENRIAQTIQAGKLKKGVLLASFFLFLHVFVSCVRWSAVWA